MATVPCVHQWTAAAPLDTCRTNKAYHEKMEWVPRPVGATAKHSEGRQHIDTRDGPHTALTANVHKCAFLLAARGLEAPGPRRCARHHKNPFISTHANQRCLWATRHNRRPCTVGWWLWWVTKHPTASKPLGQLGSGPLSRERPAWSRLPNDLGRVNA
jgi:hypothetical protein